MFGVGDGSSTLRRLLRDRFGEIEFEDADDGNGIDRLDAHHILEAYTIDENGNEATIGAEELKQFLADGMTVEGGQEPFIQFITDITEEEEEIEDERKRN